MVKRRRRMTKRESEGWHARERARQRYGVPMTQADLDGLVWRIQCQESTPVERQSNRVFIHRLWVDGRVFVVAYDRHRKQIVTFLPLEGEQIG